MAYYLKCRILKGSFEYFIIFRAINDKGEIPAMFRMNKLSKGMKKMD